MPIARSSRLLSSRVDERLSRRPTRILASLVISEGRKTFACREDDAVKIDDDVSVAAGKKGQSSEPDHLLFGMARSAYRHYCRLLYH